MESHPFQYQISTRMKVDKNGLYTREVEGKHFRGMEYGYLWWIISRKKNIYAAIGNSGNVIYINPEKRLVVAVASYFKPTIFDRVDFIQKYIEPFAESAEKS
jgi:CubicO group peptidase (beta-lactamase class C family)